MHSDPSLLLCARTSLPVPPKAIPRPEEESSKTKRLRKGVNAKLIEGDISAAVRLVVSEDTILQPTDEVLEALRLKHPEPPADLLPTPPAIPNQHLSVSTNDITRAIRSFPASSSGGIDGLRPGHIKDLTSPRLAEAGIRLISSITKLVNLMLNGDLGQYARDLLFSANLTALKKKDGGIRPIAVGNIFRRLAAKAICNPAIKDLSQQLQPIQLGVGVPGGCEVAAHAIRLLASSHCINKGVMVKLDLKNAFNSVRRDHLLEVCRRRAPSIFPLARLAYGSPSSLLVTEKIIPSSTGVQQGDPLGPLLFALAVDDIARSLSSPVNLWYLDDATLAGPAVRVLTSSFFGS